MMDEIETVEDAFASAITPKTLNGVELYPFTLHRRNVAYRIGISGDEKDLFNDTIIICWLMTRTDREVSRASIDKEQALIDAFKWAEENGFDKDNRSAMVELVLRVFKELDVSTQIEQLPGTDSGNSGGPPLTSRRRPARRA